MAKKSVRKNAVLKLPEWQPSFAVGIEFPKDGPNKVTVDLGETALMLDAVHARGLAGMIAAAAECILKEREQ